MLINRQTLRNRPSGEHLQEIINIDGKDVAVDVQLIPLIKELNKVGLKTNMCCIGGKAGNKAFISFDTSSLYSVETFPETGDLKGSTILRWEIK